MLDQVVCSSRPPRRSIALVVTIAMIASLLTVVSRAGVASAAPGAISGTVFRDENFDGAKAGEVGEPGVAVSATDSLGVQVTTTSLEDGSYTLATTGMSGPFTVEFAVDPSETHLRPGPMGDDSRGDVRTADDGAENVDFGVVNPAHYCQSNPTVVTNCYVEFDQISGPNSDGPVLVQTEYLAAGDGTPGGGGTPETAITNADAVGTTWGLAIDNNNDSDASNNLIYAASFMKRFAGYGAGGPGAIYQLNAAGDVINSFTIAAGTDPHDFTTVGSDVPDAASYAEVGKQSFGDIDISEDGTRLYVVNLFDQTLYEVDVDGGAAASFAQTNSWPLTGLPSQTCSAGTLRPMAVGVNDGEVFVGTTCDGAGGTASDLVAHVHRMTPSVGTFTHVTSIDLDYARTEIGGGSGIASNWRVWNDNWVADVTGWGGTEVGNPQPILSDIEFDNGSLALGIRDRYGDQTGYRAPSINWPGDSTLYSTDSAGDMLRVCRIGPGSYAVEGQAGCEVTNGGRPGSGPGGVEWYDGDNYITGAIVGHSEIGLGGLAANRLSSDIISTGYDTLDDTNGQYAFSNGLYRLDHESGDKVGQYRVVADGFGKAAGLGDIEAHCNAAPVEIGNFVWLDNDKDGVQDPDEPPLEGVVVSLSTGDSVTTGPDGYYSFTVEPNTSYTITFDAAGAVGVDGSALILSPAEEGDNVELDSNALDVDGTPTITVETGDPGENDHSLDVGLYPLTNRIGNLVWFDADNNAEVDQGEDGIEGLTVQLFKEDGTSPELDDSDTLVAETTTDAEGVYWFEQVVEDMTYYVVIPEEQDAAVLIDGREIDPATLASSTGGTVNNNNDDNGDDGEPQPTFITVSGPIDVEMGAEPESEVDDNIDPARDSEAYIEAAGASDFADNDSNLTVDLGLVQTVRIGNLVWFDGASGDFGFNNGEADPAESADAIGGVTVELYSDNNGLPGLNDGDLLVEVQTTNEDGEYWFDNVVPGTYVVGIPEGQTGQTIAGESVDLADLVSSTPPITGPPEEGVDDNDDGEPTAGFAAATESFDVDYFDNPTDESGHFKANDPQAQETAANAATSYHVDNNSDLSIDFGFVEMPLYRLGNLIWWDLNGNGSAQVGEPGIEGVTVELWLDGGSEPMGSTTTDSEGHYWFEGLRADGYYIVIPPGQTGQQVNGESIDLANLTLGSSAVADPDANGDEDNDNNGVPAVVGNATKTGVIWLGDPNEDTPTEPINERRRADDPTDDEPISTTDVLPDAQSNLTLDIGYVIPVRVGNVVWLDDGGGVFGDEGYEASNEDDGQADSTESGIEGVLVQLLDDEGSVVAETLTDADGVYVFDGLESGDFQVAIPAAQTPVLDLSLSPVDGALDGLRSSTGQSGSPELSDDDDDGEAADTYASISDSFELDYGDEATDEAGDYQDPTEDGAEDNVNTNHVWLPDDHSNLEVDFGFAPTPSYQVGNLLWEDYNNNGLAEDGEPGIAGVLVQLLNGVEEVVAETVTDADGHYLFADLDAGDYQIHVPADQTADLADPQPDIVEGALDGLRPTDVATTDPDDPADIDNDSNGLADSGTDADVTTGVFSLGEGSGNVEPLGETLRDDDPTLDELGEARDDRSNLAVDLGFWRGLRLGNQVFLDGVQSEAGYDNGLFDEGETGIAGVALELFIDDGDGLFEPNGDDGSAVDTATTDTEGNYLFEGLAAGVPYFVAVTAVPDGYSSTGQATSPVLGDNDDDGAPTSAYAAVSDVIELEAATTMTSESDTVPAGDAEAEANALGAFYPDNNSELTVDFGFIEVPIYRLGNLVWEDANDNGTVDPTEPGLAGVLVQLLNVDGEVIAETVSDASGNYHFDNLMAGKYSVRIPSDQTPVVDASLEPIVGALDGFVSSDNGEEADPDDDVDNNDNGLGLEDWTSGPVMIGPDPLQPAFGTEPTNEVNVADGTDDDPDADAAGAYPDAQSNYSVDFGFYQLALGNQIWFDTNGNGSADPDEPGLNGVTVELHMVDDEGETTLTQTTKTTTVDGTDGIYSFNGLTSGTEYVVVVPASQMEIGGPLFGTYSSPDPSEGLVDPDGDESVIGDGVDGDDSGVDPDAQQAPGDVVSAPVQLTVGDEPIAEDPQVSDAVIDSPDASENLTVDFGFVGLSIGDSVWVDDNKDGLQGVDEGPVEGVVIELWSTDDSGNPVGEDPVAETTTDPNGTYLFTAVTPGEYVVQIVKSNFENGGPLAGMISTAGNGVVAPDPDDDIDGDDSGNPQAADGLVQSMPVTLAYGTEPTGETGSDPVGFPANASNLTVDFGFVPTPLMSLGNTVWIDADNSGTIGPDELGAPEVAVELWPVDTDGAPAGTKPLATTTTDDKGYYLFTDVRPGEYVVAVPASNFDDNDGPLNGFVSSSGATDPDDDVDQDDNGVDVTTIGDDIMSLPVQLYPTLEPSETDLGSAGHGGSEDINSNLTVDFGFYPLGLGNRVFFDTDNSGSMDEEESGVAGVLASLVNSDGDVIATTTTDTDGFYLFSGFPEGDYQVVLDESNFNADGPLASMYSSTGNGIAPDADESVVDGDDNGEPENGPGSAIWTTPVSIEAGDEPTADVESDSTPGFEGNLDANSNLTVDFGVYSTSLEAALSICEGKQEVPGVVVNLLAAQDSSVFATESSDAQDMVEFDGLAEGTYQLELVEGNFAPAGPLHGCVSPSGATGAVVSEPIEVTASASPKEPINVAFALVQADSSIGDHVWSDTDGDGIQDPDEPGLADVEVQLINAADGSVLNTVKTAADGSYQFDQLLAGEYIIAFVAPLDHSGSPQTVGSDDQVDSDADPSTGKTMVITLADGQSLGSVDAGFVPPKLPELLAFSGSNIPLGLALAAVMLLGFGVAFVIASRRRKLSV